MILRELGRCQNNCWYVRPPPLPRSHLTPAPALPCPFHSKYFLNREQILKPTKVSCSSANYKVDWHHHSRSHSLPRSTTLSWSPQLRIPSPNSPISAPVCPRTRSPVPSSLQGMQRTGYKEGLVLDSLQTHQQAPQSEGCARAPRCPHNTATLPVIEAARSATSPFGLSRSCLASHSTPVLATPFLAPGWAGDCQPGAPSRGEGGAAHPRPLGLGSADSGPPGSLATPRPQGRVGRNGTHLNHVRSPQHTYPRVVSPRPLWSQDPRGHTWVLLHPRVQAEPPRPVHQAPTGPLPPPGPLESSHLHAAGARAAAPLPPPRPSRRAPRRTPAVTGCPSRAVTCIPPPPPSSSAAASSVRGRLLRPGSAPSPPPPGTGSSSSDSRFIPRAAAPGPS